MKRRALLQALGAALLPRPLLAQSSRPMTRKIPSTDEHLPAIGLGTWQTFDVDNDKAARAELAEVLEAFTTSGKLIDSSPMYGTSESVAGELIAELSPRPRLFIATKAWTTGRAEGLQKMHTSSQR